MKTAMVKGELILTAESKEDEETIKKVYRTVTEGEGSHLWSAWTNGKTLKISTVGYT